MFIKNSSFIELFYFILFVAVGCNDKKNDIENVTGNNVEDLDDNSNAESSNEYTPNVEIK